MNDIAVIEREMADEYEAIFNPRMMIIDRNNGKFNHKLSLLKDQMIGFYHFNHIEE